jgi:hypothetical protein
MVEQRGLNYLKHHEIDYTKWNRVIEEASNSRVYAAGWFLDRTATEWDALVWGDYQYVMPLPVRKKWGITYAYQPLYCQQLGIFPNPDASTAATFYDALIRHFRYFDLQLNASNLPPGPVKGMQLLTRKNLLLHLQPRYETIRSAYATNTRRNIDRAMKYTPAYAEGISLEEYIGFAQKNQTFKLEKNGIQKLKSIIAFTQYKGFGKIFGVYSPNNQLCAAVFFCRWKNRLIYLSSVTDHEGKRSRAMFYLMDKIIEKNAGRNLQIDFEGSMIPGVARFFEGFGAKPEAYCRIKGNRLPAILKWIKKS